MDNPRGYVYRVGQRLGGRMIRTRQAQLFQAETADQPMVEPMLAPALSQLSTRQRQAVVMVHALGWTHAETAEFLGLSKSTVQRHVERGMKKLRTTIGVDDFG